MAARLTRGKGAVVAAGAVRRDARVIHQGAGERRCRLMAGFALCLRWEVSDVLAQRRRAVVACGAA